MMEPIYLVGHDKLLKISQLRDFLFYTLPKLGCSCLALQMMGQFSLSKFERVRSQKITEALFAKKAPSMVFAGFRFSWVNLPTSEVHCAVLFISSKKKLKTAVERNRRKRLLRELYRLNKTPLLHYLAGSESYLALSLNYVGIEPLNLQNHQAGFQKALNKLIIELQKRHTGTLHPAH